MEVEAKTVQQCIAPAFCTMSEFAARVGVSEKTVKRWVKLPGFPSFKAGAVRRIQIEKADAWLISGGADASRKSVRSRRPRAVQRHAPSPGKAPAVSTI